jgi:hypothetical protein
VVGAYAESLVDNELLAAAYQVAKKPPWAVAQVMVVFIPLNRKGQRNY